MPSENGRLQFRVLSGRGVSATSIVLAIVPTRAAGQLVLRAMGVVGRVERLKPCQRAAQAAAGGET